MAPANSSAAISCNTCYGLSKTALNAITLAFAIDIEGINVNDVTPGFTATALNNSDGNETVEEGAAEAVGVPLLSDDDPGAPLSDRSTRSCSGPPESGGRTTLPSTVAASTTSKD